MVSSRNDGPFLGAQGPLHNQDPQKDHNLGNKRPEKKSCIRTPSQVKTVLNRHKPKLLGTHEPSTLNLKTLNPKTSK